MGWFKLYQLSSAALLIVSYLVLRELVGYFANDDNNNAPRNNENIVIPDAPSFNVTDFSDLASSFDKYKPVNKSDAPVREKTAEEIAAEIAAAKQKIDKTLKPNFVAFDEEHQIGLVGIFKQDSTFAVLQVINYETRQIEYKQLRETEVLKGYELVSVNENSVILNNGQRELELVLFKRLNG